jgi:hypothetical protein
MHKNTTTTKSSIQSGPPGLEGYVILAQTGSFDPTAESQVPTGVTLPKGAVIVNLIGWGGATGGSDPTVHVGFDDDDDAVLVDQDADDVRIAIGRGNTSSGEAVNGEPLDQDRNLYGIVGTSAATGGTFSFTVSYHLDPEAMDPVSAR